MTEPFVIAPEGELDLYAVRALAPELNDAAEAAYPRLIVDLSRVTFVDSSGLGTRRSGRASAGGRVASAS